MRTVNRGSDWQHESGHAGPLSGCVDLRLTIYSGLLLVLLAVDAPASLCTGEGGTWVKRSFNTSALFEGFVFGSGEDTAQTVWDVDGDGENEIILVHAWAAAAGSGV